MKILLVGTWSSLNKGDFAMHQALIKEISKRIDNSSFDILTPFPELDRVRYQQYFNDHPQIHFIQNSLMNPFNLISLNLQAYIKCLDLFKMYDAVIDVSGDAIGEGYAFSNTIYRILYLNLFKSLNLKLILAPQSVGPFTYSKVFYKEVLQSARMIYLRDPLSFKYLQDIGLENISLTGDLAFLLGKSEIENKYCLDKIKHGDATKIGLNLSYLLEKYFTQAKTKINIIDIGIKLCNQLYSTFDKAHITFIPHVFGPEKAKDDRELGRSIYDNLSIELKKRFILIEDEMDHESLKTIISEMDIFIGARMHACIGAISTGTPFLNITYSYKSIGLISQYLGLPKLCMDIRSIKDEGEAVDKIMGYVKVVLIEKEDIRKILTNKSIEFRKKSEGSIDEICKIIIN